MYVHTYKIWPLLGTWSRYTYLRVDKLNNLMAISAKKLSFNTVKRRLKYRKLQNICKLGHRSRIFGKYEIIISRPLVKVS